MPNKEELAALMASDGDYEKKISLLKKAVVTVTKQKQELESRQTQLQDELHTTTQHLMEVQRENTVLQRKVKSLEGQLEQERSSGSAFGQNMLKGLSSIMGSSDGGGRGDRGCHGSGRDGRGGSGPQLALSAEDVERLVTENEQLHREKYTYKTKFEDAQRTSAKDAENLKAEVAQLQKELAELQRTLDIARGQCDRLNADYLVERALGDFCRHFFFAALCHNDRQRATSQSGAEVAVELRWPAESRSAPLPDSPVPLLSTSSNAPQAVPSSLQNSRASVTGAMPVEVKEQVVRVLQGSCATVKTFLRGISVLLVVLREQLPRRERATVGDLECLRDRLSVFLDAHTIQKDRLVYLLERFESYLANVLASNIEAAEEGKGEGEGAAWTVETLVEAQDEVLQLFLEWISLLRAQTPLLVESCVSYLSDGHTYTLHVGKSASQQNREDDTETATADLPRAIADRAAFVEEVTKSGYATLACVEGALTAARMLIQRSPTAYRSSIRVENADGALNPSGNAQGGEEDNESNVPPRGAASHRIDVSALLALQQFWWEGCASVRAIHASSCVLHRGMQDVAEACNKSEVRDALQYLCKCLRSLGKASADKEFSGTDAEAAVEALQPANYFHSNDVGRQGASGATPELPPVSPSRVTTAAAAATAAMSGMVRDTLLSLSPASAEAYEEILVALAAADRAAATYYTQMNHLYQEMADKEDALQTVVEAAQQMEKLLEMERAESEHTRQTMQAQISVLSNQLIEMADAAQTQQLQRLH